MFDRTRIDGSRWILPRRFFRALFIDSLILDERNLTQRRGSRRFLLFWCRCLLFFNARAANGRAFLEKKTRQSGTDVLRRRSVHGRKVMAGWRL